MFDPTTLPTARSGWPDNEAPTLTASSGAEVAAETTVSPTTSGLMPNLIASDEAPRTSTSPPPTRRTKPTTTRTTSQISTARQ